MNDITEEWNAIRKVSNALLIMKGNFDLPASPTAVPKQNGCFSTAVLASDLLFNIRVRPVLWSQFVFETTIRILSLNLTLFSPFYS